MTGASPIVALAAELRHWLSEERVVALAAAAARRRVSNGAVTAEPTILVRPASPYEVSLTVCAAVEHGVELSILGDGHDAAGRSVRDEGVVVDLSDLKQLDVHRDSFTVHVRC